MGEWIDGKAVPAGLGGICLFSGFRDVTNIKSLLNRLCVTK